MAQNIGIPVQLDKPRVMRFGMDSAEFAEDKYGINLMQMDPKKLGFKQIKQIVFASLLENDPNLKYEEIGTLIDTYEGGPFELLEKATEAAQNFFRTTGRGKPGRGNTR